MTFSGIFYSVPLRISFKSVTMQFFKLFFPIFGIILIINNSRKIIQNVKFFYVMFNCSHYKITKLIIFPYGTEKSVTLVSKTFFFQNLYLHILKMCWFHANVQLHLDKVRHPLVMINTTLLLRRNRVSVFRNH